MTADCERRRLIAFPQLKPGARSSLRGPLIASLSGVTLVVLLLTGALICLFTARFERELWAGRQTEVSAAAAAAVGDWFAGQRADLDQIAALDADLLRSNPEVLASFLGNDNGWIEIARLDAGARTVASTAQGAPSLGITLTQPLPDWFERASGGRDYLRARQPSSSSQPELILAIPDEAGGVVVGQLSPQSVHQAIENIQLGETGAVVILDAASGILVARSGDQGELGRSTLAQSPATNGLIIAIQTPRGRLLSQTSAIPGLNWTVTTTLQEWESQWILRVAVMGFTAGLLALWGLNTLFSARFLRRMVFIPVDHLRRGAETLGQGDLNYRITILNDDEIGAVTGEFNHMAARLAEDEHRLVFARDQVMQATRLRSEILANVSHELRTPLGIILGLAEMLQRGCYGAIEPAQCQPLADIIQYSGQLNQIINNLLDQSQLDAHTASLAQTPFHTGDLISECAQIARYPAEHKGLQFSYTVAKDLPATLRGDPVRLRQIMVNLLDNAVKFTATGKIELRVYRPGPDHWAIQVADTGCGIPPEARQLIFEPFRQVDGSATREQNGAGLGLSIAKHLVDLMGGSILLESQVGRGSTFTVLLPILPVTGKPA